MGGCFFHPSVHALGHAHMHPFIHAHMNPFMHAHVRVYALEALVGMDSCMNSSPHIPHLSVVDAPTSPARFSPAQAAALLKAVAAFAPAITLAEAPYTAALISVYD